MYKSDTVKSRCDTVWYNKILPKLFPWLSQNIHQNLTPEKYTPYLALTDQLGRDFGREFKTNLGTLLWYRTVCH